MNVRIRRGLEVQEQATEATTETTELKERALMHSSVLGGARPEAADERAGWNTMDGRRCDRPSAFRHGALRARKEIM